MSSQPNDLWTGGPWEQPAPVFPAPPAVEIPPRRPPVLRPRRRRGLRRALFPFLTLFVLVVSLTVGTVAVRYLWPQEEHPDQVLTSQSEDPFGALERADTGTGVTVTIQHQRGEAMLAPEIYQKCVPSIVSLWAEGDGTSSTGTGIVMSADGYLLTNAHVVANSLRVYAAFHDDTILEAKLVGADADADVAVLKVDAHGLTPAEFGDSDQLLCGDMVVAIGDPLGYRTSITQGIVSALNRIVNVDGVNMEVIQTSAPINFGNSGGALINDHGQVVGITTMKIVAEDNTVEGLGFAIPMTNVKETADWLIAGQPALGFTVDSSDGTLRVSQVEQNSNAYAAGLRADDRVTALNGTRVSTIAELKQAKADVLPGDIVSLQILRSGETLTITYQRLENGEYTEHTADVTLRDKPATEESSADSETEQDTQGGSNGGSRENEGQAGNQNGGASSDEELQELFGELFGGYRQ